MIQRSSCSCTGLCFWTTKPPLLQQIYLFLTSEPVFCTPSICRLRVKQRASEGVRRVPSLLSLLPVFLLLFLPHVEAQHKCQDLSGKLTFAECLCNGGCWSGSIYCDQFLNVLPNSTCSTMYFYLLYPFKLISNLQMLPGHLFQSDFWTWQISFKSSSISAVAGLSNSLVKLYSSPPKPCNCVRHVVILFLNPIE